MRKDVLVAGLNAALDRTITLDKLIYGKTNIAKDIKDSPGGKATNVSMALKNLGVDFTLVGLIAGSNGVFIEDQLHKKGIDTELLKLPGETRVNYKIFCEDNKTITEINDKGQQFSKEDADEVLNFIIKSLNNKKILALCGSIPPGISNDIYANITSAANKKGIKVILDVNAKLMGSSLLASPFAIKPNREELEGYTKTKLNNKKEIAKAANDIAQKNSINTVVVSLGKEGAIGCSNNKAYHASSFDIIPVSTVGAGDSMVAALIYCMLKNMSFEDTLLEMIAFSTMTASLGAGIFASYEIAQKVKNKIIIQEILL